MQLPRHKLRLHHALAALAVCALLPATAIAAAETSGEQIYREQCARCHGKAGEGTADNHPEPLAGDKTVIELTNVIHETMPDDADSKCSEEDAAKVAAFIYDAFYSSDARVRNRPARIELSRLTVRQYQNVVTDIVGSFRPSDFKWGADRGLHAQYFAKRNIGADRKIERTDAEVHFNWGKSSPDPQTLDPKEYSIAWDGSVLAPDTGTYEFVVRTEHACNLFVNNLQTPLIEAWVKSGDDTEHRAELHLLGGRAYPIKLEFSRFDQPPKEKPKPKKDKKKEKEQEDAKQSETEKKKDDEKKDGDKQESDKDKEKKDVAEKKQADQNKEAPEEVRPSTEPILPTSISLEWKRPNHALEVIAARYLAPKLAPPVFVLQTRFPPDDRSVGYERGTAVSKAWDEATTEAALETAGYIGDHLEQLSGANPVAATSEPILRKFCTLLAETAFRRPLSDEQMHTFITHQFESTTDLRLAAKRSILLVLKSPRFLYREVEGAADDPYNVAARMSFGLWDSIPDIDLVAAARKDKLKTRDQIAAQLERMLPDLRTRSKLRDFFLIWLKVSQPRDIAKDPKAFPEFTPEVISDLRSSLELTIDELLDSDAADFRQLVTSDDVWLNGRLAKIYGVELPADTPFQKVDFEPAHRAGVLSHPYLLASLAYTNSSSPIHRGVFISRSVLGRVLRPPATAVAPLPAELHADLSTRERVALQTQPEACQGCHAMINPLGFTLENFDAIGRFRDRERDHVVDASGSYLTQAGAIEKFQGVKDIAKFIAASDESHTAFVKQLFHHTVKQSIFAYGPAELPTLEQSFEKNGYNIRKLLVDVVASSSKSDTKP